MKKILYQGIPGSNSYSVAARIFGKDANLEGGVEKFKKICGEFLNGDFDYLILPIENSLAGSVYENYDNLFNHPLYVIGEYSLRIEHSLLTRATDIRKIKRVYSHPKALEQCEIFFEQYSHLEEVAVNDTAGSAKLVAESSDVTTAAIASPQAGVMYELPPLLTNIEDDHRNFTRFFIIAKQEARNVTADKASVVFSTSHKPGSLFQALKTFADHRLNLTKIESRPLPSNPFEYFFYVDFEFDPRHRDVAEASLEDLRSSSHFVKVLGLYKKSGSE